MNNPPDGGVKQYQNDRSEMARPKTYVREEVIDKAMELFWRLGYEGAHLAALVEHTGLNRFSLYKEFGGKAGLYEAALERFLGFLLQSIGPA